jgi:DNA-binding MarR family transcriptional regulator
VSTRRSTLLADLDRAQRESGAQSVLFSQAVASRLGIHPTDLETLDLLFRQGSLTAGQIASATELTTAAVTSLIDRLEARGYARRVRDPDDRRKVRVEIDRPRAEHEIAPFYARLSDGFAGLLQHYTDEEAALIRDYLQGSYELIRHETERLQESRVKGPDQG